MKIRYNRIITLVFICLLAWNILVTLFILSYKTYDEMPNRPSDMIEVILKVAKENGYDVEGVSVKELAQDGTIVYEPVEGGYTIKCNNKIYTYDHNNVLKSIELDG